MADKGESGESEQRALRSCRERNPPDRYGDYVSDHVPKAAKRTENIEPVPVQSSARIPANLKPRNTRSVKSTSSKGSRSSTTSRTSSVVKRRQMEVQLELDKTLAEMESTMEARKLKRKVDMSKLEEEQDEKELVRAKNLAQNRLALELAKIDEDEDVSDNYSQNLSDEPGDEYDSDVSKGERDRLGRYLDDVKNSAFKSTPLYPPQPLSRILPEHPSLPELQEPRPRPSSDEPRPGENSGGNISLQDLVKVMKQIGQLEQQPVDRMDRFLIRQTMGKDLPYFSGEPEEWPGFEEEFRRSTKMCGFSDGENLNRLRKCLKGRAKETVHAMMVVPENVEQVMETLKLNFGKTTLIIESLIDKARKVPSPKDGKLETVITYSNTVRNLVITMESLKRPDYMNNPVLLKELVDKLPDNFRLDWAKRKVSLEKDGDFVSLKEFGKWVVEQAEAIMEIYSFKSSTKEKLHAEERKPMGKKQDFGRRKEAVHSTAEFGHGKSNDGSHKPKVCGFCDKPGHATAKCFKFDGVPLEDRWKWAKDKKVCYSCLESGHQGTKCQKKIVCGVGECTQPHNSLLHFTTRHNEKKNEKESEDVNTLQGLNCGDVILRVVKVVLGGPKGMVSTYALLDDCSTVTMVDSGIAKAIGANGPNAPLRIKGANGMTDSDSGSRQVSLTIRGYGEEEAFELNNVRTMKNLKLPSQSIDMRKLEQQFAHLSKLGLKSFHGVKPKILIGQRHGHLTVPREMIEGNEDEPMATRSKLGWVIQGPAFRNKKNGSQVSFHIQHDEDFEMLHELVKDSFRTEAFGVKVIEDKLLSLEGRRVKDLTETTTRRVGNKWETGLLGKEDDVVLPESKSVAMKRLLSSERQMDKDTNLAEQYCKRISEYVTKGYARKLTSAEASIEGPKTWYLPHFMVEHPNKPGKLRLVFDAAAKSRGVSLNDNLLKGVDLLNSLPGVLCKFRQRIIGFSADIKEMFHQVAIREEDVSAQRFLWRGMDRENQPSVMQMNVMVFGAVSSPYSAQEVKNRNAKEFESEYPEAVPAIVNRHYMDDYLDSADTIEESQKIIESVIEVHHRGGFEIGKWICSSKEVLSKINPALLTEDYKDLTLDSEMPIERVLGLSWDPNEDLFLFRTKFQRIEGAILEGSRRPTKREILRIVMSVYDPLGFLALLTIKARILLQDIWRSKIGWDDELPTGLNEKWDNWLQELKSIREFKLPRYYALNMVKADNIQLHVFCDASELAFAAVGYLRIESEKEVEISLVMAKTRVSPLKLLSIPRLELQAAVMGSRMAATIVVQHEIVINEIFYWTDSKTVIDWLRSDVRRFKPFVAHRVGEVEDLTNLKNWRWLPTSENVADEATRDNKPSQFGLESRWINGPSFLKKDPSYWPQEPHPKEIEDDLEASKEWKSETTVVTYEEYPGMPDISRFSKWTKLIRTTAWMIRFVAMCYAIWKKEKKCFEPELTVSELVKAEALWMFRVQKECFSQEIELIKKGKKLPGTSRLKKLSVDLVNGYLVVRGRDRTEPLILDPKHRYTQLFVSFYHEKAGHHGQERVLNELRKKYWILDMRSSVKNAKRRCLYCKIQGAKPSVPEMGDLPDLRLEVPPRPFWWTGFDYFGPMTVAIGRRHEKRYGALFRCLSTGAVHMELASSLSTDSVILAIRSFIGRRGHPKAIYSDNGTNFRGADTELTKALEEIDQARMIAELAQMRTEWHFIPPSAPHMGGTWERMVRSVKVALKHALKATVPKEEVLRTLLVEAEYSVNSRPLTHVSSEPQDPSTISPNDILIGRFCADIPMGKFTDSDLCLRKQWRVSQRLADIFWKRWINEYLPTLTKREKWYEKTKPLKIGDLVVIADGNLPRNYWPRGQISEVFPGKDGQVRVVDVRTTTGTFRRPVVKVCRLDVDCALDIPRGSSTEEGMSSTDGTAE